MSNSFTKKTFSRTKGVRLPKIKNDKKVGVIELDEPKVFYVPMLEQKGKEATVTVEVGEYVKKGSVIGKTPQISVFSPCSGVVKAISNKPSMQGKLCKHVIIENNFKNEKQYYPPLENLTRVKILKRVVEAGILDRLGVPLITSLNIEKYSNVKSIIINLCADEPYVTNNISLLLNYGEKIADAIKYISIATGVNKIIVAINNLTNKKSNNFDKFLSEFWKNEKFSGIDLNIEILSDRYPIGDEIELLYALTKTRMSLGENTKKYGYVLVDASVLLPLYSAVNYGKPDFERLVTLTGCQEFVTHPYFIKNGTTIDYIINQTVSKKRLEKVVKIVAGGPFRGMAISDSSVAFDKTQISLMFLTTHEIYIDKEINCIQCGKCTNICPRNLMPYKIDRAFYAGDFVSARKFGAEYCSECGCCGYVCPAKRHLVQRISMCKKEIIKKGINKCH